MQQKILEQLKTKYANLGFSEKTLTGVADFLAATVKEETQIEPAISGAEPLLKVFQGEIDGRVTTAVNKAKETFNKAGDHNQQNQQQNQTNQQTQNQQQQNTGSDMPEWAKKMLGELSELKTERVRETLQSKLKEKLKNEVPETFLRLKQFDLKTEADIDTVAETAKNEYAAFKQEMVNSGLMVDTPRQPEQTDKASIEFAKQAAERRNRGTSPGVEGKPLV